MTELESYIRSHASDFDTQEPAAGHEERFLARLDAAPATTSPVRTFLSTLQELFRSRRFPALACALAACVAVLLILRPGDPFRSAGNDPEAIYLAYMNEVVELYNELPPEGGSERDATLQVITEEEDPLFTQLPAELTERQRARILKEYYGELLATARKIKYIQ